MGISVLVVQVVISVGGYLDWRHPEIHSLRKKSRMDMCILEDALLKKMLLDITAMTVTIIGGVGGCRTTLIDNCLVV